MDWNVVDSCLMFRCCFLSYWSCMCMWGTGMTNQLDLRDDLGGWSRPFFCQAIGWQILGIQPSVEFGCSVFGVESFVVETWIVCSVCSTVIFHKKNIPIKTIHDSPTQIISPPYTIPLFLSQHLSTLGFFPQQDHQLHSSYSVSTSTQGFSQPKWSNPPHHAAVPLPGPGDPGAVGRDLHGAGRPGPGPGARGQLEQPGAVGSSHATGVPWMTWSLLGKKHEVKRKEKRFEIWKIFLGRMWNCWMICWLISGWFVCWWLDDFCLDQTLFDSLSF